MTPKFNTPLDSIALAAQYGKTKPNSQINVWSRPRQFYLVFVEVKAFLVVLTEVEEHAYFTLFELSNLWDE